MMMDCPRCGFSQPKDRYCANCGLDVDNFKPVADSNLKKLAQSTVFQVGIVIAVVVALGSGIYTAQKKEVAQQLEMAQQNMAAPDTAATSTASDTNTVATQSAGGPAAMPANEPVNAPAATPTGESQLVETSGTQEIAAESPPTTDTAPTAGPAGRIKSLNVQFIEIPRLVGEQLAAENQILDRSGNTYSFVIMSQPSASSLGTGIRPLPGSTTRAVQAGQKIELSFPQQASAGTSMMIDFSTLNIGDQDIEFDIASQINLMDAASEKISNINFNGKYTIPKGSTLVIVGLLPHQALRQEDVQLFGSTPLSIMISPAFKNSTSEFALFIQPK